MSKKKTKTLRSFKTLVGWVQLQTVTMRQYAICPMCKESASRGPTRIRLDLPDKWGHYTQQFYCFECFIQYIDSFKEKLKETNRVYREKGYEPILRKKRARKRNHPVKRSFRFIDIEEG